MPDSWSPEIKGRLIAFRILLVLGFLVLIGQLWRLQMVKGAYYQEAADVNRFRLAVDRAPRGVIYDRRGYLLVRNQPQISVSIVPAYLPDDPLERHALLVELARLLEMPLHGLSAQDPIVVASGEYAKMRVGVLDLLEEAEMAPYRPARLKTGVPRETALVLEEEHLDWPGVLVQVEPARDYVQGPLLSHILGFVGPIPQEQADAYEARGYDTNQERVGLAGVEYSFEDDLRGRDGQKLIEVDVAGQEIRTADELEPAIPGHNLRLTLDLELQQEMEEILSRQLKTVRSKQAVAIAMNPQTGEILGMVSLPSYDNNEFTGGISSKSLEALQKDVNRPLVNHAISGQFPPGSTYKVIIAAGALEEEVVTLQTRYYCGGILWLPNRFYPDDPSLAQPF